MSINQTRMSMVRSSRTFVVTAKRAPWDFFRWSSENYQFSLARLCRNISEKMLDCSPSDNTTFRGREKLRYVVCCEFGTFARLVHCCLVMEKLQQQRATSAAALKRHSTQRELTSSIGTWDFFTLATRMSLPASKPATVTSCWAQINIIYEPFSSPF